MLVTLNIKDFALIEQLQISFTAGLNVLTGETGAGKSILIDAINAVLGGKVGPSAIRASAEKAQIEATFRTNPTVIAWLKQQELIDNAEDEIVVSREINKTGSRLRINGTLVNNSIVQDLRQLLLTIHAQHEARTLMSSQSQLEMLDALGDQNHKKILEAVKNLYADRRSLITQIKDLQLSEEERLKRLDLARFQLNELQEAKLNEINEDETLTQQRQVLSNVVQLNTTASNVYAYLTGSDSEFQDGRSAVIDSLQLSLTELERVAKVDDNLSPALESLRQSLASIEETAIDLRRYRDGLDTDPESLAEIESRIAILATIKRKYGPTLADAINKRDALQTETDQLENSQNVIDKLSAGLSKIETLLFTNTNDLTSRRNKLAENLGKTVQSHLADLGMGRCQFLIVVSPIEEINSTGMDRIEFVIAPNPGQPPMPLSKIASGGELSRVMLAIKSIFANADGVASVIFDEIDTGLSGKVLQSVRDKLASLARSHQILCITHQPIIASVADNHIEIHKEHSKNDTKVSATQLDETARLKVLASMASGEDNQVVALDFARSLLDQAQNLRTR
jgi:DNA repair protein RecN (Recombination protein N)